MVGGLTAIGYFLLFQGFGLCVSFTMLKKERTSVSLLLGSVAGLVMLMWFPAIFALLLDFTILAHVLGALLGFFVAAAALRFGKLQLSTPKAPEEVLRAHPFLGFVLIFFLFFCYLVLHGFSWRENGIYSSQATFGDMSMHLGFITSIARQGTFPPDYSILPGTKLDYPFLCDSVSSSLLLLGAPLRLAYVFPMFFAGAQVMGGAYLLAYRILKDKTKAALTWIFFFFNGGFGFVYFLDGGWDNFKRIFSSFYETPTNLSGKNIQWVNVVVDMLLPQRATLFGFAVLFSALYLLYRAAFQGKRQYFLFAGVLLGALPMIHTHSFLFAGLLCFGWLIAAMVLKLREETKKRMAQWGKILFLTVLALLAAFQGILQQQELQRGRESILLIGLMAVGGAVVVALCLVVHRCLRGGFRSLCISWGALLIVVLFLALPQLLFWTFTNAGSLVRGHFNWKNLSDHYLLFYLKNLGLVAILLPFALCFGKRTNLFKCILPGGFVWLVAEFIQFQPNAYDNNKLLYPAYLFFSIAVADFGVDCLRRLRQKPVRVGIAGFLLAFASISAVFTMGREAVASYQLFGEDALALAAYVETLPPKTVILTDQRHNNEIAAITGRNIVCGAGFFLAYHGQDFSVQQTHQQEMYENPAEAGALFAQYQVDYVLVSGAERNSYGISEKAFAELYECVYNRGDIYLFRVTD